MNYDVVVVGAGPIGSIAARAAALKGAKVLLIEEHASIGSPVGCTGLLSTKAISECGLEPSEAFVFNSVRGAFVHAPDGQCLSIDGKQTKAYVVSRKNFDRKLAALALEAGVELSLKTRALGLEKANPNLKKSEKKSLSSKESVHLKVLKNGKPETISTSVLIGADGIKSRIAHFAGLGQPKCVLPGIQIEAPYASKDPDFVELFPGAAAPGFFAWTVPVNEKISRIGLALDPRSVKACRRAPTEKKVKAPGKGEKLEAAPLFYLQRLLETNPQVKARYGGGMLDFVVGGIPIGPLKKTVSEGIMLVGDAAGQTKPTSGGGIYPGAFAAKIAGRVAAEAALAGDPSEERLLEYERLWRKGLEKELEIGMRVHDYIGNLKDEQLNALVEALNKPSILDTICEYGDMDRPSILLKKFLLSGNSLQFMRIFGTFLKTLF